MLISRHNKSSHMASNSKGKLSSRFLKLSCGVLEEFPLGWGYWDMLGYEKCLEIQDDFCLDDFLHILVVLVYLSIFLVLFFFFEISVGYQRKKRCRPTLGIVGKKSTCRKCNTSLKKRA